MQRPCTHILHRSVEDLTLLEPQAPIHEPLGEATAPIYAVAACFVEPAGATAKSQARARTEARSI